MTKELESEIYKLKRDLAFKREELQAMYLENKNLNSKINELEKENYSFKKQIKQLEEDYQTMYEHP